MPGESSPTAFVTASGVRTEVVRSLADAPADPAALIAGIDASESAVYNALSALEDRGLIRATDAGWALTGAGRVVGDLLWTAAATDDLLDLDPAYWRNHDPTVLPSVFRRRLHVFRDGEVLRADDTDPERVIREIARTIGGSDPVDIITPVYHSQYAEAIAEAEPSPAVRLLLDATLFESLQENPPMEERDPPETVDIRIAEAPFALVVTGERVLLSLPTVEGEYDARTELAASSRDAHRWAETVFEHCWTRARPLEMPI